MNDPLYRELSQLTLRYRWLIASVTVVVLAAAMSIAPRPMFRRAVDRWARWHRSNLPIWNFGTR